MLYKNVKHAFSSSIEIINEINEVNFLEGQSYFLIAKKDDLRVIQNKSGANLVVDVEILELLKKENLVGGIK